MDSHSHYVRVRDLRLPHLAGQTIGEYTVVTFEDLERGSSVILQDSLIDYNGHVTHNFIIHQELRPRRPYRVTAYREDGSFAESIATTPGITITRAEPDEHVGCRQKMTFQFDNVLPAEQIRVEAGFEYQNEMHWFEISRFCEFSRDEQLNRITLDVMPRNLLALVFPPRNANMLTCENMPPRIECDDLSSNTAHLRFLHLGPEWQRVYPLIQVNPENVMDVENGLGFFGAYRQDVITYSLSVD